MKRVVKKVSVKDGLGAQKRGIVILRGQTGGRGGVKIGVLQEHFMMKSLGGDIFSLSKLEFL